MISKMTLTFWITATVCACIGFMLQADFKQFLFMTGLTVLASCVISPISDIIHFYIFKEKQ